MLIFLIDTLRADRLGVYGYDKPTSPNMDALAAEGVVFEQCNAPAPWTLPSVVSLLTSTFPCEHDVLVDRQKVDPSWHPLAVRMKVAGYTTATLFSNGYVGRMSGLDRGYDFARSAGYTDGPVVEGLLDKVPAGPLYLYVHNIEPHNPYEAADWIVQRFGATTPQIKNQVQSAYLRFRKLSKADWEQNRPRGSTDNTTEQTQQIQALQELKDKIDVLYDAAVWQADERLGSVIDVFKSRGLWDNTLMIVVADHGEELGDHGGWQHDQSVYEELMHVPLIVRFPQGRFAGRRVSQAVSLVDVMPTIFDVLGKPALAQGCRGTSLMPLIEGQAQRNPDDMVITGMRINRKKYYRPDKDARGDFNVVVRQGRFKGIWNVDLETPRTVRSRRRPLGANEPGRGEHRAGRRDGAARPGLAGQVPVGHL